ncbi:MAG: DUF3352 domain-containing protein, partial [Microcoleaceae cyanobacterium]
LVTGFVNFHPTTWQDLSRFGTPPTRNLLEKLWQQAQKAYFPGINLDFQKDIQPWLGSVAIALLPPDQLSVNNTNPQFLILVGIRNPIQAWLFTEKLQLQTKVKTEYQVAGKLVSIKQDNDLAWEIIGNYLAIAPNREIIARAKATALGKKSVVEQSQIIELLQLEQNKLARQEKSLALFIAPDYSQTFGKPDQLNQIFGKNNDLSNYLASLNAQLFNNIATVVIKADVQDQGVKMRVFSQLKNPMALADIQPMSSKILNYLPKNTVALFRGYNLQKTWLDLLAQARVYQDVQIIVDNIRQGFARINLNADTEVFNWMDGEFALGLITEQEHSSKPLYNLGSMIFWETKNSATAQQMLDSLEDIANITPTLTVRQTYNRAGKMLTEWNLPELGKILRYGWLDEKTLFMAFGETAIQQVISPPGKTLPNSQIFQKLTISLPEKNQGYLYVDMDKTLVNLKGSWGSYTSLISPEAIALLDSIQGMGLTITWNSPHQTEIQLLLTLKENEF